MTARLIRLPQYSGSGVDGGAVLNNVSAGSFGVFPLKFPTKRNHVWRIHQVQFYGMASPGSDRVLLWALLHAVDRSLVAPASDYNMLELQDVWAMYSDGQHGGVNVKLPDWNPVFLNPPYDIAGEQTAVIWNGGDQVLYWQFGFWCEEVQVSKAYYEWVLHLRGRSTQ